MRSVVVVLCLLGLAGATYICQNALETNITYVCQDHQCCYRESFDNGYGGWVPSEYREGCRECDGGRAFFLPQYWPLMEGGKHVLCLLYYYHEGRTERYAEFCTHKTQLKWDGDEDWGRFNGRPTRIGTEYFTYLEREPKRDSIDGARCLYLPSEDGVQCQSMPLGVRCKSSCCQVEAHTYGYNEDHLGNRKPNYIIGHGCADRCDENWSPGYHCQDNVCRCKGDYCNWDPPKNRGAFRETLYIQTEIRGYLKDGTKVLRYGAEEGFTYPISIGKPCQQSVIDFTRVEEHKNKLAFFFGSETKDSVACSRIGKEGGKSWETEPATEYGEQRCRTLRKNGKIVKHICICRLPSLCALAVIQRYINIKEGKEPDAVAGWSAVPYIHAAATSTPPPPTTTTTTTIATTTSTVPDCSCPAKPKERLVAGKNECPPPKPCAAPSAYPVITLLSLAIPVFF